LETLVPLRPQDFIIFATALQPPPEHVNVVSTEVFEAFKDEIWAELAAQRATQE